jgi:phosphoglycerate kinase
VSTLKELLQKKAKLVLLRNQGSDIEYDNFYTRSPMRRYCRSCWGRKFRFIDDCVRPAAREAIRALAPGEALLLDKRTVLLRRADAL